MISLHLETQKALVCDLCENMKDEFVDDESGIKEPQCILVCPKEAISLKDVEQIGEETRIDAVKRLFGTILEDYKS